MKNEIKIKIEKDFDLFFRCDYCNKYYKYISSLKREKINERDYNGNHEQVKYICPNCWKDNFILYDIDEINDFYFEDD